jgi:DNA-binding SARP family transcriptional activator
VLSVHVLGPVEVRDDDAPIELGGPQQRAVVAHLALEAGHVVSVERLIDRLWGDEPPRTPLGTLLCYISRLRRVIEPERDAGAPPRVLVSEAPGYVLQIDRDQIDVHRFMGSVADGRAAAATGMHAAALRHFDAALALWRGPALAGVGPEEQVRPIVVRLEEERAAAVEDRFDAMLALGRHAQSVPAIQAAVEESPLRERLWAQLALALYRSSRQADALRALATARTTLLDELGLDPGPELRQLENRILAQDPSLLVGSEPAAAATTDEAHVAVRRVELVGRGGEWAALTAALERATSQGAQVVLLEGEPGIGKSTLSDAFLRHAAEAGWHTAVGRCVEPGLAPSLWPAIEIVRSLIGAVPQPVPEAIAGNRLFGYIVDQSVAGAALSPVEMADEFVALLDVLGATPAVLLLDDLHWADRATLDVTTLAVERLAHRKVVVLGAHRPPDIVPGSLLADALSRVARAPSVTRLSMSPLGTADVARLMELTTGAAPSDEVAAKVQVRAGGNPLFVSELARLAGERGVTDEGAVPDAIRDVVRGRLAQLPDNSTAELQVAAILGERFDLRVAIAASERTPDDCLDALDSAIVTRILVPDGDRFRFAHALVRDAVLATLTPLRTARLHHRAAEALIATYGNGPDIVEPIAYHRLASLPVGDALVVARAAVRAADAARWRAALDRGDELAEQALDVLARLPRTQAVSDIEVEALEAFAASASRRNDPAYTARVIERVNAIAERTGSEAARSLALFMRWDAIDEIDDLDDAKASTERARELAERAVDRYAIVMTRYMLGGYAALIGDLDEADAQLAVVIEAAGAPDADTRPHHVPLVMAPVAAGIVAAARGDHAAAREHAHRRTPAWLSDRAEVDPTTQSALAFNSALIEALLDEPAAVLDLVGNAVTTDANGLVPNQVASATLLAGWARARAGDRQGAEQAIGVLDEVSDNPHHTLKSALVTFVGHALLEAGDRRAVDVLALARGHAESRGEVWWLAETVRLQAVAEQRFGSPEQAAARFHEARRLAERHGTRIVLHRLPD